MAKTDIPTSSRRRQSSAPWQANAPLSSGADELIGQQTGQQIGRQGQRASERDPSMNPRALRGSDWRKESNGGLAKKAQARTRNQ
jgi:hypothetical protein